MTTRMGTDRIKVLVADSSAIFIAGLATVLLGHKRIEVVDHAHDGQEVLDKTKDLHPDIVLMDAELPGHGGIRATEMLQGLYPEVKVVILTPPAGTEALLHSAIRAGVKGFLIKTVSSTELINSIIQTADEGASISPKLMPLILGKLAAGEEKPVVRITLSIREREVMELVADGKNNREIGEALFISENTVKGHLRRIIDKLQVNNRVEVARYVLLKQPQEHQEQSQR